DGAGELQGGGEGRDRFVCPRTIRQAGWLGSGRGTLRCAIRRDRPAPSRRIIPRPPGGDAITPISSTTPFARRPQPPTLDVAVDSQITKSTGWLGSGRRTLR